MENNTPAAPPEKSKLKLFWEALPLLEYVGAGLIALCAAWSTIQFTQNSQAAELRETKNRIVSLESLVDKDADKRVTKEVFDERTNAILKSLEVQRREFREDFKSLENRIDRPVPQPYPLAPQN